MKKLLMALMVVLGVLLVEQPLAGACRAALCSGVLPAAALSGGALLTSLGMLPPQVFCVLPFAALAALLWSLRCLQRAAS